MFVGWARSPPARGIFGAGAVGGDRLAGDGDGGVRVANADGREEFQTPAVALHLKTHAHFAAVEPVAGAERVGDREGLRPGFDAVVRAVDEESLVRRQPLVDVQIVLQVQVTVAGGNVAR